MLKQCALQLRKSSLEQLLKRCEELADGRKIHESVVRSGLGGDRALGRLLMGMYSRCKSPDDAFQVFEGILEKNLTSWTQMIVAYFQNGRYMEAVTMFQKMQAASIVPDKFVFAVVIAAYAQNGHPMEAVALYWQMLHEGYRPDTFTLIVLVRALTMVKALPHGRAVYGTIVASPMVHHSIVANCCITMFGKCGSVDEARSVFECMKHRDSISWNALLAAYTQHGNLDEAWHLFHGMQLEGEKTDDITFVSILGSCRCLKEGREVHKFIGECGWWADHYTANALLSMYGRCGSVDDARRVFDELPWRSAVSWGAMLTVYTQHSCFREAVELWLLMNMDGTPPDRAMFLGVLTACARLEDLGQGRLIHACLLESGVELEPVLETSLVNMYGKCGSIEEAREVLDGMPKKNVVSWNSMISAYAQNDYGEEALRLFREMDLEGCKPSKVTFVSVLDACAIVENLVLGMQVHGRMVDAGMGEDVELNNGIVNMYGKCGGLPEARRIFDGMIEKNVVSWNVMMMLYSKQGYDNESLGLFRKMDLEGFKPDRVTYVTAINSCACLGLPAFGKAIQARAVASGVHLGVKVSNVLINLYGKFASLEDAEATFEKLTNKDIISWNALLTVYVQRKSSMRLALSLFRRMDQEGVKPDVISFVLVLDACAGLAASALGRAIHERAAACGYDSDEIVQNAVLDMYGKCGNIPAARREFDKTKRKDVVCWTSMIAAYAQSGDAAESLKLFWRMQQDGVRADGIAFLCVVFACTYAGKIKDAFECFVAMEHDHKVKPTPEHYSCIIDLLGKSGWLNEAEELVNKVAGLGVSSQDLVVTTRSLLGACAVHGDTMRGSRAADRIQRINHKAEGLYVLLSNIYSSSFKK